MKMKEIQYSRKFNLGNYENEEISLTAELEGLEDISDAFRELKETVFCLQGEGTNAEPPSITRARDSSIPWSFNSQEFLSHPWKGKKNSDGSYQKGSCDWGWDFKVDREGNPNFSVDALKILENGPVNIGDDYVVKLNETKILVQISKQKKRAD